MNNTGSQQPLGGTEIMIQGLQEHVAIELLRQVHISVSSVPSAVPHIKPHVFWAHQSFDQPSVQNLKDELVQQSIDAFVFVSQWQKEQYIQNLDIPREKTTVIPNAVVPITCHEKPKGPLQLVYTSTPFRGLDVLLSSFELLGREDVALHIYSGMSLYGRIEEDEQFEVLYDKARRLPGVFYHGVVSNSEIQQALKGSHIFAYPCTWEETSCVSLIEALSAGCLAVVPELGALPETASGFAQVYAHTENKQQHVELFAAELSSAIDTYYTPKTQSTLAQQVGYFQTEYSWSNRQRLWEDFLQNILRKYEK